MPSHDDEMTDLKAGSALFLLEIKVEAVSAPEKTSAAGVGFALLKDIRPGANSRWELDGLKVLFISPRAGLANHKLL